MSKKLNPQEMLVADGLESIPAACQFLGVSRSTLYSLMDRGELPFCKIARCRRIPKKALIDFASSNLFGAGVEDT